ncbi:FG-GAP and VCBS repeat-containing protein [Roseiconus nitratireducens]|uniref:FG-GAP and VCBS repeat-containing protein n=1 Tax=Roseiconus nitratireducens TaxID=2605748 RepID=UPI0013758F20|nr:FG-GAP and VCBS repeat-containing protein [Roseiconus nitratireducens]
MSADQATEVSLSAEDKAFIAKIEPSIRAFCGDCHAVPRPASSPAGEWQMEIEQGFMLYGQSGRDDLIIPHYDDVLRYFKSQAPSKLTLFEGATGYPKAPIHHSVTSASNVPSDRPRARPPAVTNVQWTDLKLDSLPGPSLVFCDIGTGTINAYWPNEPERGVHRLGTVLQPVHVQPTDLDQDEVPDLLVADIGEFDADDSDLGRVVWLRRDPETEKYSKHVLAEGLGRVADARTGDFDGDGDTDVLIAAFGWRTTGATLLLENTGPSDEGLPEFQSRVIDDRHGPVHVPPVDFDGDGDLDFIALISQEHERVELFRNDGSGQFNPEVIWKAPDPAYGSSGIELVDLDDDGDMDVLYTNGDSFDRGAKPHHSVQWLENTGTLPMTRHELCHMPGALNATAGDFDGDGDKDVIAVSLLAPSGTESWLKLDTSSIVMLVQDDQGNFQPTKIEGRAHNHISVAKGDFNGDGKLDFAVGNFLRPSGSGPTPAMLEQPDLLIWQSR